MNRSKARKVSANYIFTGYKWLKNSIVSLDNTGQVVSIEDTGGNLRETAGLEFHNGLIVPYGCIVHTKPANTSGQPPFNDLTSVTHLSLLPLQADSGPVRIFPPQGYRIKISNASIPSIIKLQKDTGITVLFFRDHNRSIALIHLLTQKSGKFIMKLATEFKNQGWQPVFYMDSDFFSELTMPPEETEKPFFLIALDILLNDGQRSFLNEKLLNQCRIIPWIISAEKNSPGLLGLISEKISNQNLTAGEILPWFTSNIASAFGDPLGFCLIIPDKTKFLNLLRPVDFEKMSLTRESRMYRLV